MPNIVENIREFLELASRKDVKAVIVKTNSDASTKFKLRGHRLVYTLTVESAERAKKIRQSLPPGLEIVDISSKAPKHVI